jgi:hypothetical protein
MVEGTKSAYKLINSHIDFENYLPSYSLKYSRLPLNLTVQSCVSNFIGHSIPNPRCRPSQNFWKPQLTHDSPQRPIAMSIFNSSLENMEFQDAQRFVIRSVHEITARFQKVPGSAMLIRYIQSSYQDDPVRSAIELVLVIFFVRYLLSPSYSTKDGNFVKLTEEVSYFFLRLGRVEGGKRDGLTDAVVGNR